MTDPAEPPQKSSCRRGAGRSTAVQNDDTASIVVVVVVINVDTMIEIILQIMVIELVIVVVSGDGIWRNAVRAIVEKPNVTGETGGGDVAAGRPLGRGLGDGVPAVRRHPRVTRCRRFQVDLGRFREPAVVRRLHRHLVPRRLLLVGRVEDETAE